MNDPQPMSDPKQALVTVRIIWGAIAMGMITFAGVVLVMILGSTPDESVAPTGQLLFYIACGLTATAIPVGLFVRGQVFKRGWVGDVITPGAYTTGNIVAWACCEAPAIAGLVGCMIAGSLMPNVIPAVAAFVMHLLLWPNGRAMFPPRADVMEDRYPTTR